MASPAPGIATRLLILSDTHGARLFASDAEAVRPETAGDRVPRLAGFRHPLPRADVAIHCGDLTLTASAREFRATFDLMRAVDAPLKLLIPGNHDVALDRAFCAGLLRGPAAAPGSARARQVRERYAAAAELARGLRRGGEGGGGGGCGSAVHLLDEEGAYHFVLANGARLAVYASPHTPEYGAWAFQYRGSHDFAVPPGTDLAVTHGPPRGLLDEAWGGGGGPAGCPHLLAAVARARPRVHCFGHIHEGWGAKLVTWREEEGGGGGGRGEEDGPGPAGGGAVVVDEARSVLLADLAALEDGDGDDAATRRDKRERANALARGRAAQADLRGGGGGGPPALRPGRQTLFVNAAVMSVQYRPYQLPWLVDLDLPPPDDDHVRRAEATAARLAELAERPVEPL